MNLFNHGIEKANGDIPVADCPDKLKENVDANPSDINSQVENNEKVPEMTENADVDKDPENKPLTDDNGEKISDAPNHLAPNKTFTLNGIEYKTDDNGNLYCVDDYQLPNNIYRLEGHVYRTDDNGNVFSVDGNRIPNISFCWRGKEYHTDDEGKCFPESPDGYRRPYLRQDVVDEIYEKAPRDADGRLLDPNTMCPIDGTPDIGHKPGHEHWRESQKAFDDGISQEEFNDRMNNPEYYQLEDRHNNRSHQFEDHTPYVEIEGDENENP